MLSESEDMLVVAVDEDGTFNRPSMGTLHLFASPFSAAETLNIEQQHLIFFLKLVEMSLERHFIKYSTNISIFKLLEVPRIHKEVLISDFCPLFTLRLTESPCFL